VLNGPPRRLKADNELDLCDWDLVLAPAFSAAGSESVDTDADGQADCVRPVG